jgi:hypothetical protein
MLGSESTHVGTGARDELAVRSASVTSDTVGFRDDAWQVRWGIYHAAVPKTYPSHLCPQDDALDESHFRLADGRLFCDWSAETPFEIDPSVYCDGPVKGNERSAEQKAWSVSQDPTNKVRGLPRDSHARLAGALSTDRREERERDVQVRRAISSAVGHGATLLGDEGEYAREPRTPGGRGNRG